MATERRGFTLIELMVTIAIVGIVAALGISSWTRARQRAQLSTTMAELQSAFKLARQKALSTGRDVAVVFFPKQGTWGGGLGRIVALYDGDGGFLDGTGVTNLCAFKSDPVGPGPVGTKNVVLAQIDLPRGLSIGPPIAMPGVAVFPFTTVPAPASGCTFCDAGLTSGAVRFDGRGQATFYTTCGAPLPNPPASGGAVVVNTIARPGDSVDMRGSSVLMILPTGLVRTFHAGYAN